jgi:hypothetical protein
MVPALEMVVGSKTHMPHIFIFLRNFCKAVKDTCWPEFHSAQNAEYKILCMYVCTLCLWTAVFAVGICCLFPSSIISIHSPSDVSASKGVEP